MLVVLVNGVPGFVFVLGLKFSSLTWAYRIIMADR